MSTRKFILVAVALFLVISAARMNMERFSGSDWGNSFWGPAVWNGWNYGSAPLRKAPEPEE